MAGRPRATLLVRAVDGILGTHTSTGRYICSTICGPRNRTGPRSFCAQAAAPSARLGASTPLAQRRGWHHLPRKRAHRGNHNQPAIRGADGERGAIILLENAQDVGDLFAVTWTGPSPADHDPLAHIGGR